MMGKSRNVTGTIQEGYQPKIVPAGDIQTNGYQPSGKPNAGYQPISHGGNSTQEAKPPSKR